MLYKHLIRPLLFQLDPEVIHDIIVSLGQHAPTLPMFHPKVSRSPSQLAGLSLRNPVGLAAGFDKNAVLIPLLHILGFGFVEVGSVTRLPSKGNPRPRLFRLPDERGILNRMGLNNDGADIIAERLRQRPRYVDFPIGVNIAKTHSPDIVGDAGIRDVVDCFRLVAPHADFVTLNISCPNTREGKTFEDPSLLNELLSELWSLRHSPLFVKLSPDFPLDDLRSMIEILHTHKIDGIIATNTQRDSRLGGGGLSGAPVSLVATERLRVLRSLTHLPLIASGGVMNESDVQHKKEAGASLVEIYTGFIYEGPCIIRRLVKAWKQASPCSSNTVPH